MADKTLIEALRVAETALDHCVRPAPGMSAIGFIAGRKATAAALKTVRDVLAKTGAADGGA